MTSRARPIQPEGALTGVDPGRRRRYNREAMGVGTFRYRIDLAANEAGPFVSVDALVDTGATYS